MSKIDIDKFIIALFKSDRFNYQDKQIVKELIKDQGLEYKYGEITRIEPGVPETDFCNKTDDLSDFKKVVEEIADTAIINAYGVKDLACRLLTSARKELESEGRIGITRAEFESELEYLYKYADEVQYNRGHDDGYELAKKDTIEEIKKVLLSEVLPCFMHGEEADKVVAKLDEVITLKSE